MARQRQAEGLTSLRFDLMFYGIIPGGGLPGAWVGNDPSAYGTGNVTVDKARLDDALAHLRKHGYCILGKRPSRLDPEGINIRIRESKRPQKTAICFGCKRPIAGRSSWVRVDSRTFAHASCVEGAR